VDCLEDRQAEISAVFSWGRRHARGKESAGGIRGGLGWRARTTSFHPLHLCGRSFLPPGSLCGPPRPPKGGMKCPWLWLPSASGKQGEH
jgi:hypothetical protein